jgi:uncharacterized protein (DUF58 family)
MYGGGIVASLMTAATYSNNLVYFLSFFLVGLFLIGMIQANNNLKNLSFERLDISVSPENAKAIGRIWLKNSSKEDKYYFKVSMANEDIDYEFFVEHIEAGASKMTTFELPTPEAGIYRFRKIKVSSVFPFGIFYTWKLFSINQELLVYPEPQGKFELEADLLSGDSRHHQTGIGGEDYSEHKKYEHGEPVQHIDWKAFARGRGMLTKKFKDGDSQNFQFFLKDSVSKLELQQMSKWVLRCGEERLSFCISRNGDRILPMGTGKAHITKALGLLAREAESVKHQAL